MNGSAEVQAASNVFDSLTPEQQRELVNFAEALLVDSKEFNGAVRQRALASIASGSAATAAAGFPSARNASEVTIGSGSGSVLGAEGAAAASAVGRGTVDVERVVDDVMPFALASVPDAARAALIGKLRDMLLNHA